MLMFPHFKMAPITSTEKLLALALFMEEVQKCECLSLQQIFPQNIETSTRKTIAEKQLRKNSTWVLIRQRRTVYARFLKKPVLSCCGRKAVPVQRWIWRIARTMLSDLDALNTLSAIAVIISIWKPLIDGDEKKMSNFTKWHLTH